MNAVKDEILATAAAATESVENADMDAAIAKAKRALALGAGAAAAGYAGVKLVKPVAAPVVKGGLLATGALIAYEAYSAIVG